jgi:hypothetical protein
MRRKKATVGLNVAHARKGDAVAVALLADFWPFPLRAVPSPIAHRWQR